MFMGAQLAVSRMHTLPAFRVSVNSFEFGKPDTSNNVGPVKSFLGRPLRSTPKSGLPCSFDLCIDDHGWLIIFRSASVRP